MRAFLESCGSAGIVLDGASTAALPPAQILMIQPEGWRAAAHLALQAGVRWCAFWADERPESYAVFCCLEKDGEYVVLESRIKVRQALPSQAPVYPAADRAERHARDLLGVQFEGAPDNRRWTRHQAWSENEFPLLRGTRVDGPAPTLPDDRYPFVLAQGASIVEIPVGPVHAGIIEPGHFRFQAMGETVINLEEHLGYVHKGIEKLGQGRDACGLARLAGRISGDTTVAHTWAACQALERAAGLQIPNRAIWLRALMAERERVANHLGDIGAICNDVGFAFAQSQLTRLKEDWVRENQSVFGHRFMMDRIIAGGVCVDPDSDVLERMRRTAVELESEFSEVMHRIESSQSLEDRLQTTGRLSPDQAQMLGVVGYVGRASGLTTDVRANTPYSPYDSLAVEVPSYRAGDVAARAQVRVDEVRISLGLICQLIDTMPGDAVAVPWQTPDREAAGLGIVEGWRGEIITYVRLDQHGSVERFFPRDPSWLNWPALELLMQENIVPDFPVCNKSVNGSYSGQDL